MDVKQEINTKAFTLPHSFLLLPYLKPQKNDYKSRPGARGIYIHNGLRMYTPKDFTDITYQHIYMAYFLCSDPAKFKGLLIKIKVIKGFSAKLNF